eukprot:scaffold14253_cov72-Cyclotella_meneghiniana.AAC.1
MDYPTPHPRNHRRLPTNTPPPGRRADWPRIPIRPHWSLCSDASPPLHEAAVFSGPWPRLNDTWL